MSHTALQAYTEWIELVEGESRETINDTRHFYEKQEEAVRRKYLPIMEK